MDVSTSCFMPPPLGYRLILNLPLLFDYPSYMQLRAPFPTCPMLHCLSLQSTVGIFFDHPVWSLHLKTLHLEEDSQNKQDTLSYAGMHKTRVGLSGRAKDGNRVWLSVRALSD